MGSHTRRHLRCLRGGVVPFVPASLTPANATLYLDRWPHLSPEPLVTALREWLTLRAQFCAYYLTLAPPISDAAHRTLVDKCADGGEGTDNVGRGAAAA